ncbi:hypothetical protein CXF92_22525 [Pseudomonas sp. Choline-3u-10]|jgi:uncharacterized protein|uniref:hypothetical protein n=1 Tax=Pseudomonadaceae TaxID=135621 RepID=UPI000617CDAD|nr:MULTISPECIES: hypothetical protein [Pseudomonadaceae]MAL37716.1 hypothetical protein [Pseudomonas sp.]MBU0950541.1 hypothetical protein [Gammaproteobacteria bacterium]KJJ64260.1 hypothetical protein RT21_06140 [Pseudomonas sp. 10B238]MBK3796621.1 hypothetical protein [Stutzerimonas stutzeri]MBK3877124.1 hypothetical protein [Stutzerimonas stutzeri]|tara:strand:+ start:2090 stop:2437 length:348 start_codon:yes stop_codon:yes gene_type:complete
MSHDHSQFGASLEAHDDQSINPSANPALEQLVDPARRNVLKGGLSLAALSFFTGVMGLSLRAHASSPLPNFKGVPVQIDPRFDHVLVAEGLSGGWAPPIDLRYRSGWRCAWRRAA